MSASPTPSRPFSIVDLASLLFLGAVWGGAFLFLRIAAPEVGPVWAAEARIGIAALILVAFAGRRTWAVARGRLVAISIVGVTFSAVPFTLIAVATLTLPTGLAALLMASTPLFTALLGIALLGQRLTVRLGAGLAAGTAAVLVLVGWSPLEVGPRTLLAVAASLGAAISYAVAGTHVRRSLADVGGIELATGQLASGALLLLPVAILSGPPRVPSLDGAVSLVAVATVSTVLAWPVFFRVLSHTTATVASTVTFIVPAFGILWGALALGEAVGPGLVAGFGLVLVSLVLVAGIQLRVPTVASRAAHGTVRAARAALAAVV